MRIPWLWVLASILAGGVIHIAAILGLPYLGERDAWARLAALSSENQVYVLPPGEHDAPLPLMAPDIGYAFCRFDLTNKNVLVKAEFPERTWSAAVYTRQGENFYLISGADAKRKDLRLLIVPRARLPEEASTEKSEEGDEQNIVIAPAATGIVLIRAPIRGAAYKQRVLDVLRNVSCDLQAEPAPDLLAAEPEPPPEPKKPEKSRRSKAEAR